MCTLSWRPTESGYVLMFNRDEQRSRKPALPPTRKLRNRVYFLAPIDTEQGGTWMLVNAYGLSVCLLNHYPATSPPLINKTESRGNLVLNCSGYTNVAEVIERTSSMSLALYKPFQLVAIDTTGGAELTWDGRSWSSSTLGAEGAVLSSSSYRSAEVVRTRHGMFNKVVGSIETANAKQLEAFHRYRGDDPADSVFMSRPDACTHSISRIVVSESNSEQGAMANFYYEPQAEIAPIEPPVDISMKLALEQACI